MLFPLQSFSKAAGLVQDQNQSSPIGHLILWRETHVFYPLHGFLLLSACSLRLSPLAHVFMTSSTVLFLVPLSFGQFMTLKGCPPASLCMYIFLLCSQCSLSIPFLFYNSLSLENLIALVYLAMFCQSSEVTD